MVDGSKVIRGRLSILGRFLSKGGHLQGWSGQDFWPSLEVTANKGAFLGGSRPHSCAWRFTSGIAQKGASLDSNRSLAGGFMYPSSGPDSPLFLWQCL
jgi:hypothetical protein